MKKLFGFLLIIALLVSMALSANAAANTEEAPEAVSTDAEAQDAADTETSSDSDSSSRLVFVPSEDDLPDGYVVDEDWYYEFELGEDDNWSYTLLEEMLGDLADGEYIYFVEEKEGPDGYTAFYAEAENGDGHIIIIKNVQKEEPGPQFSLPKTGGNGTALYTAVGAAFLLAAASYGIVLHCKRKENA